uniref:ATP synthase complex subunit 8 n=2 Tax=Blattoidea TaxID=1049657 RepID=A0A2P1H6S3_9NEOP|nr:ATP synthase F0 subunit 8 [Cryptocercus meridianus]YP_010620905.1 ATP synthase F0 subunit 8 [Anaplecta omei]AVN67227.1 ATP synthase F0 subunit 8 [Anaplecta omei]AVT43909.1 ATP synthase F0 subunit 8 [Cryptocercus meridianus]WAX39197.1 ATP synthase F0 subunit 8 [Anaplecta omei]
MPQMMPLNWLTLFIMFSLTFILFNIISYYNFNYSTININTTQMKPKAMNWKW